MSHEYTLRCADCGERCGWEINHGEEQLKTFVAEWPKVREIEALAGSLSSVEVDVRLFGQWNPATELFAEFMRTHEGHAIDLIGEYASDPIVRIRDRSPSPVELSPMPNPSPSAQTGEAGGFTSGVGF